MNAVSHDETLIDIENKNFKHFMMRTPNPSFNWSGVLGEVQRTLGTPLSGYGNEGNNLKTKGTVDDF